MSVFSGMRAALLCGIACRVHLHHATRGSIWRNSRGELKERRCFKLRYSFAFALDTMPRCVNAPQYM